MSTSSLRTRLEAFGIRPRRRFGQNFLHDPAILACIRNKVEEQEPKRLIEIGPGPGILTDRLAELGVPIVAIEKDTDLVRLLRHHFAHVPNLEIVEGDILETNFSQIEGPHKPTVVGNIPYNISTPILIHLLRHRAQLSSVILMMQAELAQRLRAEVGTRESGSLTVLFALLSTIERVVSVPGGAFFPPPKVRSEVIKISWRPSPAVPIDSLEAFERTVRGGFNQRRKQLRNALASCWPNMNLEKVAEEADVDISLRAERLRLADWAALTNVFARTYKGAE